MSDALARLIIRLEAESSRLMRELERARHETERYARDSRKSTDMVAAGFSRLQTVAGAALGVIGSAQIVKKLAEFDKLNGQLKTVTGSMDAAGAASEMLKKASARMPFEIDDVTQSFIKLRVNGLDASQKSLEKLGNIAAALKIPLGDVVEAIAAAGRGELDAIQNLGIQIEKDGEKIKVAFNGVTQVVNNDAASIQRAVEKISDANFSTGIIDQMDGLGEKAQALEKQFSGFVDFIGNLGVRDALKASFSGAAEFLSAFQQQLNAMFGQGMQAQIDALEIQAEQSTRVLDQLQTMRSNYLGRGLTMLADTIAPQEDIDQRRAELINSNRLLAKLRESASESAQKNSGLFSAPSGASSSPKKKDSDTEAKKAAQDQIQILEAQFAEFKANLDRERQVMDASMALELERAANNAEQKLEIERRYQGNASVLKQEEIKAEIELKKRVDALNQDRGESAKLLAEANTLEKDLIATQKLAGIEADTLAEKARNAARGRSEEIKSVFEVLQERMDDEIINPPAMEAKIDEMTQFAIEGARNMQDAFADFLFDPFDKGMSGMLESFGNTIKRMLANAAASQILGALFGSEFGKTGEIGGVLGDIFKGSSGSSGGSESAIMSAIYGIGNIAGSFFAEGGRPTLGKLAVVGERGPELFVPDTAGEIIPTEAMAGFIADRIAAAHPPVPQAGGRNGAGPRSPTDTPLWKLLKSLKLAGFAEGGRPPLGKLSMVGERGPELFVPDTAGSIASAGALGRFLADGAPAGHAPAAFDSGRIPAMHAPTATTAIQPVSVQNNHSSQVTINVRGEDTPRSRQSSQQLAADVARQMERARIRNG
jgi:hypothetical protein